MGRKKTELEKALALAEELFGTKIEVPTESKEDLVRQATAVANFYYSTDEEWYWKNCSYCGEEFFFSWTSRGVGYCTIDCAKKALEKIGIKWNPNKSPTERWGRCIPAIVPPEAAKIIKEIRPKPEPDEIDNLLAEFE